MVAVPRGARRAGAITIGNWDLSCQRFELPRGMIEPLPKRRGLHAGARYEHHSYDAYTTTEIDPKPAFGDPKRGRPFVATFAASLRAVSYVSA